MNRIVTLLAVAGCAGVASAAPFFEWNWTPASPGSYGLNQNAGFMSSAQARFTPSTHRFEFTLDFSDQHADGYWLAVSPGANPKGHAGELALIYFDARDLGNPIVTIYNYNGVNGDNSFRDGSPAPGTQAPDRIASSLNSPAMFNVISAADVGSGRRMVIDMDASGVNGHVPMYPGPGGVSEWTGVSFGPEFGVWLHPVRGLTAGYGEHGFLTDWRWRAQGWLDGSEFPTTRVPTPGVIAALGLAGVYAARRRRSN
jgi:hypothetical protein